MAQNNLNTLQIEILSQEQLMIANEINKLEFSIANGDNILEVKSKKIKTTGILFSSILISLISLFIFIVIMISNLINLQKEFVEILLFISIGIVVTLPVINILSLTLSSSIMSKAKDDHIRANVVMLRRLEKYYKFLKFEFDPEKYKTYNDDFVVDIDEAGNLVKYVRFYDIDGSVTTRPFKDIDELKKYIESTEDTIKIKSINEKMINQLDSIDLKEKQHKFNEFSELTNGIISKCVIERENVSDITFSDVTIDFWPEQYQDKVSKWFTKNEFIDNIDFVQKLNSNLLHGSWSNGGKVVSNGEWINDEFNKSISFGSKFFKNYNIQKSLSQSDDVESYIAMIKNLDMEKDPTLDWAETIDPKDINKEKLITYDQRIKELEEKALELSRLQQEQDKLIRSGSKNATIKVELLDDDETYRNLFKNYNPYEGIEKELVLQEKRNKIINKTKVLLLENDLTDFNFDDLSIKELKQIVKEKQKESEELENIRSLEANEDLVKLKNEIARIKSSKFSEKHLPQEKFQNENFRWMYHDGEGNYYEADDDMEWNPSESPEINFNELKLERIKELQKEYNSLQVEKETKFNDKFNSIKQVKEKMLIEQQEKEKQELTQSNKSDTEKALKDKDENIEKENLKIQKEKEKQKTKKKKTSDNENNSNKISDKTDNDSLIETHEPNVTWTQDGQYYYHDGNNNYFTTDSNNEWISTKRPNNDIINNDTINENINNINKTQGPAANEPYQDENGTWWYFDEVGKYFYGDETGAWVPYEGEK